MGFSDIEVLQTGFAFLEMQICIPAEMTSEDLSSLMPHYEAYNNGLDETRVICERYPERVHVLIRVK